MSRSLTLRAGPQAIKLIRERGLRFDDVDVMPGASGGAKWLAIAGLDRYLFGQFLTTSPNAQRTKPLDCIGSSIGSWRLACLAQRDPVAALARGHHAYMYMQAYSPKPGQREVTEVLKACLDHLLGDSGVDEILNHPFIRLHVITAEGRGLAGSDRRPAIATSLALAIVGNLLHRNTLAWQFTRTLFHNAGNDTPFGGLNDLPTSYRSLTSDNLRLALLASGAIPLLVDGVRMSDSANTMHWDGGVIDYHLNMNFGNGDGLVLYPHFYSHVVPGWFDKRMTWRRADGTNFSRALLIAPSDKFVATLPGGRIPDRRDFFAFSRSERERRWQSIADMSERLGEELGELIETGKVGEKLEEW